MRANSYIKDIFKTWASPDLSRWRHCKICVFQFGVTVAVKYRVNWTLLTCGCFKSCYRQTGSGIGLPDGRCSTGLAGTLRCADNWDLFVWDHILGQDFIIWDHIHVRLYHLRPHSLETTFTWDHIRLRPHSLETWITFLWSTFHFFAGDMKFCKVALPLKFYKVTPFRVQDDSRWVVNALSLWKHRRGQKTLHTSGSEGSVAPLKYHFVWFFRPTQKDMFFSFIFQLKTLFWRLVKEYGQERKA